MTRTTKKISSLALLALVLVFGACKGESPTAPPPGGTPPPTGTTPPAGVNIVVTTSNNDPLVDSTVLITATVTLDNQPVPNGTAVEFSTNNGTFTDTNANTTIRTTTNGVATATLTSSVAGVSRTTVTVNNVTRTVDVTFRARPVTQPPPSTAPAITSVSPNIGRPAGGETIRITGRNFTGPVRVLFDVGTGTPVEAFVVDRTDTTIDVITPAVNLGAGQQLVSRIIVITAAGSANEQRTEVTQGFTFRNETLTPRVSTTTPNSGPVTGGTRVSIIGDGFQAPVQVLFGPAEARVIEVRYGEIIVEAPAGRDTSPDGSGTVTGPVDITVVNINSQTRTTLAGGFRYVAAMRVIAARPITGPALGGTDIVIDGVGFDSPVQVHLYDPQTGFSVDTVVLSVSGTRLVVRTLPLPSPCGGGAFQIVVTNVDNGDTDVYGDAPNEGFFQYIPVAPQITAVTSAAPGGVVSVVVQNPGVGPLGTGTIRFSVNGVTLIPSPAETSTGTGSQTFSFALPTTGFVFPTQPCTTPGGAAGTQSLPVQVPLTLTNASTFCVTTGTVTVQPPNTACVPLPPIAAQIQPAPGTCANGGSVTVPAGSNTITLTFRNNAAAGAQDLIITPAGPPTGTHASDFSAPTPSSQTIPAQQTRSFTVTFDPSGTGRREAFVVFNTNDPANGTFTICLEGTGTP